MSALHDEVRSKSCALGVEGLTESALEARILRDLPERPSDQPALAKAGRALDAYIEAQVHGPIDLSRDVEALVVDASLRGCETGAVLEQVSHVHGVPLYWHSGFRMPPSAIPEDFRGPRVPELAKRLNDAIVDASVLAEGARSMHDAPGLWADWASPEDTLQHLKQLWHCLVAFGLPVIG